MGSICAPVWVSGEKKEQMIQDLWPRELRVKESEIY